MLRKCKYQKDLIWFCPYLSTPLVLRYGLINPKNNCTFLGITTLNLLSQTELSSNTKHEAKHAVSLLSSLLKILEPVCDVLHFHDDKSQAETDTLQESLSNLAKEACFSRGSWHCQMVDCLPSLMDYLKKENKLITGLC